jgi:NAD(P)-dependent dehydrogenase (short-subunit alcohol dehydrogenase family)
MAGATTVPDDPPIRLSGWALVLGASSGFGEAAVRAWAEAGLDIVGVHLDRKATLPNAERIAAAVRGLGRQALFFNVNAADPERRREVLDEVGRALEARGQAGRLRALLHSLAFGTLRPFIAEPVKEAVSKDQMDMTLDVMAHTLVYWTQDVVARGLMGPGGRVFAMTSAGGTRVLPNYGPVSAAKAALESHVRQLAMELAPRGIAVNAVRAGVTDTPALQKIPGADRLKFVAAERNPAGRLTTPTDVARALVAFTHSSTYWMTGNVLGVDGGEDVIG